MKLEELIISFKKENNLNSFLKKNGLDIDSEIIFIYMRKPLGVDSEIIFLEIEKTNDGDVYELNGIEYCNLIDFYYFNDFIEDSKSYRNKDLTDTQLSKILYDYCINDA